LAPILQALPTGVIELIFDALENTTDVGSVRLTCRELNAKAANTLARRHFTRVTLDQSGNLQHLRKILEHACSSEAIRLIHIWPRYLKKLLLKKPFEKLAVDIMT